VNCCDEDGPRVIEEGFSETATAWTSAITALALFVESAILVAVIVTLWELMIELGAV
jgi:hypothetical protein